MSYFRHAITVSGFVISLLSQAAIADTQYPDITAVGQRFVTAAVAPETLESATVGSVIIDLKSSWAWDSFALEFRLNSNTSPSADSTVIIGRQVYVSSDYPRDIAKPVIAINDDQMTITIANVSALRHPMFSIGVRMFLPTAPWITFGQDLTMAVDLNKTLFLDKALASPPTIPSPLESWVSALIAETLFKTNGLGKASFTVSYVYDDAKLGVVELPVLTGPAASYSPSLASRISTDILKWMQKTAPQKNPAYFKFVLKIFDKDPNHAPPWIRFGDLALPLEVIQF